MSNVIAEKSVEEKLRRYERFFKNAQDLFYILDKKGRFLDMNPKFAEILGYEVEELLGKTSRIITHPEDLPKLKEFFKKVLEGETGRGEFRFLSKSGEIKWGELVEWSVLEGNEIVRVEGIARDITERKRLEEELHQNWERLKFFFDVTEDGIAIHESGIIIDANKRLPEMFGYELGEIIGKSILELAAPESRQIVMERIKSGYEGSYEAIGLRKDGTRFYGELITKNSIYMGKPVRIAVVRDITERKKLENQLKSLNEQLRILNQTLRHDVLNDLTVVSGCLQLIEPHDEHEKEMVEIAISRIEKMTEFIKRMREIDMAISEGEELKEVEIRNVVDEVLSAYPHLKSRVEGEAKVVANDAIYSVVDNIVRNAATHSGSDRLDVSIRRSGEWVEVKISDYGKGIPEKIRKRVFEEGFKYGKTGRTGLGLYIVKNLVEKYGGSVEIKDTNPTGTTFLIRLRAAR